MTTAETEQALEQAIVNLLGRVKDNPTATHLPEVRQFYSTQGCPVARLGGCVAVRSLKLPVWLLSRLLGLAWK